MKPNQAMEPDGLIWGKAPDRVKKAAVRECESPDRQPAIPAGGDRLMFSGTNLMEAAIPDQAAGTLKTYIVEPEAGEGALLTANLTTSRKANLNF